MRFEVSQVSKSRPGAPSIELDAESVFRVLLESGKHRFPGRKGPSRIPGKAAAGAERPAKEGRLVPFEPV